MDVNRVVAQIERDFEPSHVGRLLDHIRQPSVSALDWGNQEMSGMLAEECIAATTADSPGFC